MTIKVYVYADGTCLEHLLGWKTEDYVVRYTEYCEECQSLLVPEYEAPFAHCECSTQEWYT